VTGGVDLGANKTMGVDVFDNAKQVTVPMRGESTTGVVGCDRTPRTQRTWRHDPPGHLL